MCAVYSDSERDLIVISKELTGGRSVCVYQRGAKVDCAYQRLESDLSSDFACVTGHVPALFSRSPITSQFKSSNLLSLSSAQKQTLRSLANSSCAASSSLLHFHHHTSRHHNPTSTSHLSNSIFTTDLYSQHTSFESQPHISHSQNGRSTPTGPAEGRILCRSGLFRNTLSRFKVAQRSCVKTRRSCLRTIKQAC